MEYQIIFNWVAVGFYIISTVFFAYSVSFQNEKALKPAMSMALLGLVPHALSIVIRWSVTGHGPYMAKYEVLSSNAWITVLLFLLVAGRTPKLRPAGVVVMPLSFLMMAFGLFTSPEIRRLPPSLKSIWLVFHVTFAKLAAGAVIIALGTAVLYLLKEKRPEQEFYKKLPPLDVLDAYSYKFTGFGFIFWNIALAAGAIWANEAWGRYWGWDPIETWSLITWLLYGLYLHSRYFFKWRGRKAAWFMVTCFALSILTIFIIPLVVDSLHTEYFQ
jgi:cytochrome c-type biogenesis protein CcsB